MGWNDVVERKDAPAWKCIDVWNSWNYVPCTEIALKSHWWDSSWNFGLLRTLWASFPGDESFNCRFPPFIRVFWRLSHFETARQLHWNCTWLRFFDVPNRKHLYITFFGNSQMMSDNFRSWNWTEIALKMHCYSIVRILWWFALVYEIPARWRYRFTSSSPTANRWTNIFMYFLIFLQEHGTKNSEIFRSERNLKQFY